MTIYIGMNLGYVALVSTSRISKVSWNSTVFRFLLLWFNFFLYINVLICNMLCFNMFHWDIWSKVLLEKVLAHNYILHSKGRQVFENDFLHSIRQSFIVYSLSRQNFTASILSWHFLANQKSIKIALRELGLFNFFLTFLRFLDFSKSEKFTLSQILTKKLIKIDCFRSDFLWR